MDDITTQKPFACKASGCGMSFTNEDHLTVHEKKHEMILHLGLGQKSANIFVADQTPTPTRLIKNCEEVGLFDDLRHVNPFDETFRRAVEQKNQSSLASELQNEINTSSHDSLHTPQVFPNIEDSESGIPCQRLPISAAKTASPLPTEPMMVDTVRPQPQPQPKVLPMILPKQSINPPQVQGTIQMIQPQVITLNFPTPMISAIPVQTVKPFILPKVTDVESSASTTPTSALPIKERLKAILSSNSKAKRENTFVPYSVKKKKDTPKHSFDEDCLERRRAAALRYRNKIKKEHVDLRKKNAELQAENNQLKEVIKQLRLDLSKHQYCSNTDAVTHVNNSYVVSGGVPEIQIPASTVRLVMNIPKLVIQPTGQPVMKNPVTFSVEKN